MDVWQILVNGAIALIAIWLYVFFASFTYRKFENQNNDMNDVLILYGVVLWPVTWVLFVLWKIFKRFFLFLWAIAKSATDAGKKLADRVGW